MLSSRLTLSLHSDVLNPTGLHPVLLVVLSKAATNSVINMVIKCKYFYSSGKSYICTNNSSVVALCSILRKSIS